MIVIRSYRLSVLDKINFISYVKYLFLMLFFLSCNSNAGWYVGVKEPADTVTSSNVALSYINPETSVTIPSFHGAGVYFVAAQSIANDATDPHFTWTYVSVPKRFNLTSASYIDFFGVGGYTELGIMGDQRVYYDKQRRDWRWGTNGADKYNPGHTGYGDTWRRPQLIIKARLHDGGDLTPGVRTVSVPLRIAQVAATNDNYSINSAISWANSNLYNTPRISTTWIIQATITPKCWVNTTNLNFLYGDISKSNIDKAPVLSKRINISCNTPTNASVELVPTLPLSFIGKGATRCGDGLACIVEFDGQQNKKTYKSISSKSIAVTSALKVIDLLKIKEGEFKGDVVLRIAFD
ncbi:hypothetical protein NU118_003292 [Salmonella enterica]|nr:hypothetical protein [Salmonella enterica]EIX9960446.1 hypothetical protein [Salmonella enterica]EJP2998795.1 hypothetical protein [Salmonella enterica]